MTRVRVIVRNGPTGNLELDRVPVSGDFIAHGSGAVKVKETVLLEAGGPADAFAYCEVDQALSQDVKAAMATG